MTNVTLQLASCAELWGLVERECTFIAAYSSSSWPVAGLEVGSGYLFYPYLVGATATAQRLNITCPLSDWEALLATSNTNNNNGSATALAPCGTATVSSGQELLSALEALQPGHARVLITLAANISLPAQPTPQRADPAPGDDDKVPLVVVFRNVTLAGVGGARATELNIRGRRNAFGLLAGWQLLQQQQDPQQLLIPAYATSGAVWRGRPVLVLADLALVNLPPGPPSSWPLGLLGCIHYYAGLDRSGTAGVQLVELRTDLVFQAVDIGYVGFWYNRMLSLLAQVRNSATWMQTVLSPLQIMVDATGGRTDGASVGDFTLIFNATASPVPVLTPPSRMEYDLWSSASAGLLLSGPSNGSFSHTYELPAPNFAVAGNATQLLGLLQEPWSSGPRVILLVRNITLMPGEWPQGGAALSYNVTLAGPVSGPPVQLDTGGLLLARPVAPEAGAPGAAAGSDTGGTGGPVVVVVLLQRLVVVGLAPPLLAADRGDVAAASQALNGSAALRGWRDRCLAEPSVGGTSSGPNVSAARRVRWEVRNCTLVLPEGTMQLLQCCNDPAACTSASSSETASTDAVQAQAAAACAALRSPSLPGPLLALLGGALVAEGQASFNHSRNAAATPPGMAFSLATLGMLTIADSRAVSPAPSSPASATLAGNGSAVAAEDERACDVVSLLLALPPLLASPAASVRGSRRRAAAIAGGAVAGFVVVSLCGGMVAALLAIRRRRKHPQVQGTAGGTPARADGPKQPSPGVAVLVGGQDGDGPRHPPGARAPAEAAMIPDDVRFTISFTEQEDNAGPTANRAATLPASLALPSASLRRGGASSGIGFMLPAGPTTAARPGARAALLRSPERAPAAQPPLRRAQSSRGGQAGTTATGSSSRSLWVGTIKEEIEALIQQSQAIAKVGSSGDSQTNSRRARVLGRGANGSVYLGEWRGLPAAVKVLVLNTNASDTRRQQLVGEVALTMALSHPHVVPTYHFEVSAVTATDNTQLDRVLDHHLATRVGEDAEDDSDVVAVRLKLVMQYCDGGALRAALQAGRFSRASPLLPPVPPPPPQPQQHAGARAIPRVLLLPSMAPAAATTAATPGSGRETGNTTAGAGGPSSQQAQRYMPEPVQGPGSGTPPASEVSPQSYGLRDWDDLKAALNLPLSLLAARDIAAGLEYLHGQGVVHGDLTDNNVLLKAVKPVLLPRTSPHPARSEAAGAPQQSRLMRQLVGPSAGGAARRAAAVITARRESGGATGGGGGGGLAADDTPPPSLDRASPFTGGVQQGREQGQELQLPLLRLRVPLPLDSSGASGGGHSGRACVSGEEAEAGTRLSESVGAEMTFALNACMEEPAAAAADQQPPQQQQRQQRPPAVVGSPEVAHGESASSPLQWLPHPQGLSLRASRVGACARAPVPMVSSTSDRGLQSSVGASDGGGSGAGQPFVDPPSFRPPNSPMASPRRVLPEPQRVDHIADGDMEAAAMQMLGFTFKIADFGLSVKLQGGSQTHVSNMSHGTPYFAAPEVVMDGRLSPAADIYSFGVVLWLLFHGITLGQVRHLLPRLAFLPIAELLLGKASPALPPSCRRLLGACLAIPPAERPRAAELGQALEEALRDVAGPALGHMLLSAERTEYVVAPTR